MKRESLGHVYEVLSSALICLQLLKRFIQSIRCFSNFINITNSIDGRFNDIRDSFFQLHTSSIDIQKNSSSRTREAIGNMQNTQIIHLQFV